MTVCGNCQYRNPAGNTFCDSCGDYLMWSGVPAADEPAERVAGPQVDQVEEVVDPAEEEEAAAPRPRRPLPSQPAVR